MVFGDSEASMRSVEEDKKRGYSVWEEIEREGLMQGFGEVADELCMRHGEICDPGAKPRRLVVGEFEELGISARNQAGGLKLDI